MPKNVGLRAAHTHRYAKQVPGHHLLVDVKFLSLKIPHGGTVRRFQYTAINDATCIHTVRTDNGHEFQARFPWHVEDLGIRHVYIKPQTPRLNGKVERSHLTDNYQFYQLLTYTDDVDLNQKLQVWQDYQTSTVPTDR